MNDIYNLNRKSIRLKNYDYSLPGEYFVTICTKDKRCFFGEVVNEQMRLSPIGEIASKFWLEIPTHFPNVELDSCVIMPNHIHGIIVLNEPVGVIHESPLHMTQQQRRKMILSKIVGRFKMRVAKEINLIRQTPGFPVWQRNYYEHIIRNDKELNNIRDYIINNPLKWAIDQKNLDKK